jgi:hypothetical protein
VESLQKVTLMVGLPSPATKASALARRRAAVRKAKPAPRSPSAFRLGALSTRLLASQKHCRKSYELFMENCLEQDLRTETAVRLRDGHGGCAMALSVVFDTYVTLGALSQILPAGVLLPVCRQNCINGARVDNVIFGIVVKDLVPLLQRSGLEEVRKRSQRRSLQTKPAAVLRYRQDKEDRVTLFLLGPAYALPPPHRP